MGRKEPESFETYLAWVQPEAHQAILKTVKRSTATVVREPRNPTDKNACKVQVNGHDVGYIPKEVANLIAPIIDKGEWTYTIPLLKTRIKEGMAYADIVLEPQKAAKNKSSGCGCLLAILAILTAMLFVSIAMNK